MKPDVPGRGMLPPVTVAASPRRARFARESLLPRGRPAHSDASVRRLAAIACVLRAICSICTLLGLAATVPGFAGVTLTPLNGVVYLTAPASPKFTIVANLPNPPTVVDGDGNSATDTILRIQVYVNGAGTGTINASSYNGVWTDPNTVGPGVRNYTVTAFGNHYEAYSIWIAGHWDERGYWGTVCHEVDDGYWDDNGGWVSTGSHEECDTEWIDDGSEWIDGHWEHGITETAVEFGSASLTFYVNSLQATTSLTPFNNNTALASPAQPKFTIASNLGNGRTVADANGNTRADAIAYFQIHNPTHGWFDNVNVGGASYNALWTDPRSSLGPGIQSYTVYTWGLRWETYDHGWLPGYWHTEGHWEEVCHEEQEGYWDDEGNWVVTGYYTECSNEWIEDATWWVDGYRDTGFTSRFERLAEQTITFTISTGSPQTITFPAIGTHSWGEPPFELNATASSGLPVTYVVTSGPATVSANYVTVTGTGAVTITAHQYGNGAFSAAPPVSRTFSVVAGQSQTITFPALANRTFGDAPFSISATASSGLPVTFAVTGGDATVSGATVSLTGGGNVTITATQSGNATYSPAPAVSRTFAVAEAPQTIDFPALSNRVDGDAPFPIVAHASSFLQVSFSIVSGPATMLGATLTVTGPGVVVVRATQSGDSRFLAAPAVDRSFNVGLGPNGKTLTVENGTAGAVGGNPGTVISISANIPAGLYFTGWVIVAGTGYVMDVASPNTSFTMGGTSATVRATFSTAVPTYGLTWTEVNLPATITASSDQSGSYTVVMFAGLLTNSGTAAWSRYVTIEIRDNSSQLVGFGGWVSGVSGLAPGGRAPVFCSMVIPSTLTSSFYSLRAIDYAASSAQLGPTHTKMLTLTARNGPTSDISTVYTSGTVGQPFSGIVTGTNSPTNYSVVGTLPPGVTLNASTGALSGIPTTAGVYAPTFVVTTAGGTGAVPGAFTIYSNTAYPLSVNGGSASASTLTVGASANVTANTPGTGQIFNGWSVVSGPGAVANWRETGTSVRLDAPGDLAVRANYIPGNPLVVVNGTSNPLGGANGASVTITADPDGVGTMFSHWTSPGPGSIAAPQQPTTAFNMGTAATMVTANFVPGYRLNMFGGGAGASGGLPGTKIAVWPGVTPGATYQFLGFWLEGPGYLLGDRGEVTMGEGTARVHAAWWPSSSGPITRTLLWPPDQMYALYKNEPFRIRAYTDYPAGPGPDYPPPAGLTQQIDYSTDGGNTWVEGIRRNTGSAIDGPQGDNYRWRIEFNKPAGFPAAGRVIFRARADLPHLRNPVCFYMPLTILNVDAATILVHPGSMSVGVGQEARFAFIAKGNGGYDVTYQWRKDGVDLPGRSGTAASESWVTLSLPEAQPADAGMYTVAIRSGMQGLWITSNPATLVVECSDPTILTGPAPLTIATGGTASFRVTAGGPGPFAYQWRKNGTPIVGATSPSCTIANAQPGDAGSYSVTITTACGTITSGGAVLTVNTAAPPQPDSANQNQLNIHLP